MTITVIRLIVISAVCNLTDCSFAIAATTTTTTTQTRHQATTAKRRVFDFERLERKEIHHNKPSRQQRQQPPQMLQQQTDRRVIPWVSIAILLNILFFFRSIAAPFFDPLVSMPLPVFVSNIDGISDLTFTFAQSQIVFRENPVKPLLPRYISPCLHSSTFG